MPNSPETRANPALGIKNRRYKYRSALKKWPIYTAFKTLAS